MGLWKRTQLLHGSQKITGLTDESAVTGSPLVRRRTQRSCWWRESTWWPFQRRCFALPSERFRCRRRRPLSRQYRSATCQVSRTQPLRRWSLQSAQSWYQLQIRINEYTYHHFCFNGRFSDETGSMVFYVHLVATKNFLWRRRRNFLHTGHPSYHISQCQSTD